jgi:hypothetical protein
MRKANGLDGNLDCLLITSSTILPMFLDNLVVQHADEASWFSCTWQCQNISLRMQCEMAGVVSGLFTFAEKPKICGFALFYKENSR